MKVVKYCESIVISDTLILYIKNFSRLRRDFLSVRLTYIGAARKMAQFSHAYAYVSVYIEVKLSRLANSIPLEKHHKILERPWKSPGICFQHLRTHPVELTYDAVALPVLYSS